MFAFETVAYGVVMTPTFLVEPYWLSNFVRTIDGLKDEGGVVRPCSNARADGTYDFLGFKRSVYERAGSFDESSPEPAKEYMQRIMRAGGSIAMSRAYVHKYRVNGFDPRRESTAVPGQETQEANR
jgi:hypothetical protein